VKNADEDAGVKAGRPARDDQKDDAIEPDPAYAIVSGILAIVPASRWTFARVEPSGELVTTFGSRTTGAGLEELNDELKRQRVKAAVGPRIAATLGSVEEFTSGITLLFADARANYGILTLLRTPDLGPFTAAEISMLTFALDAVSEHLSALRLQPAPKNAVADTAAMPLEAEPSEGAFYVLDSDLQIILAWSSEEQRRIALTGLHTRLVERLPTVLEETVRTLTSAWSPDALNEPGVARPVPFLVVRTQPMSGPTGLFIGVRVDRFQPPNSLTGVATRYHISPREVQVLALLLDGNQLNQIATQLFITSSTVQDHIKSMLDKTESRNRSELIARVLGWEFTPDIA
jgi:DNA-binding CsgD family transcriptional regulator